MIVAYVSRSRDRDACVRPASGRSIIDAGRDMVVPSRNPQEAKALGTPALLNCSRTLASHRSL
jgi:hypothetical protein